MKLRIKGNSIRLRLGQSEVRRLLNEGIVEESITFDLSGRQRLEYILCSDSDLFAVTASFDESRIVVRVPTTLVDDWAGTDRLGIETIQIGRDGEALKILIEKDLECIEAPLSESQEDAFPHPEIGGRTAC